MPRFHIEKKYEEKILANLPLLKRWGLKGGLAILDQVVFSGANFITSILLAKWLSGKDFGGFAIGLAVLTFFMQIYTSFTLEPISVLGLSGYRDRLISYLMGQVRLLFLLSVPLGILLGLIALVTQSFYGSSGTSPILFFSGLGLPFILFPLLMRRIFYVLLKPGFALAGSVIYFLTLSLVFYLAKRFGVLSGTNSLLIVSLSSFFSGLIMLLLLRRNSPPTEKIDLWLILVETWSFGKWLVISGMFIGLATQSQIYLAGVLSSVEDAGAVRILQTFIQPMMLTFTAFSALATPAIVNDFVLRNYRAMRRKVFLFTLLASAGALMYEYLLFLFGSSLNNALFGEKYSAYSNQILIWGLIPVIWALFWGGGIALQAIQKPHAMAIISSVWVFFSLISGLIFIPVLGVWGATISIVLGYVVTLINIWIMYWIIVHRKYMRKNI
jgi:O-antigen/teichoic acid export membrane protein